MTYDRSAYKWYNKDGINKRFKTPPDMTWSEGRHGFSKPKVVVHYNFDTEDCVPGQTRYGEKGPSKNSTEMRRVCREYHGPRPSGLVCRHLCDNDSMAPNGFICVNPRHIKWDTQAANVADVIAKGMHISQTNKATKATRQAGGRAVTAKVQVCERCGHTGKLPSFGWHKKRCTTSSS